MVNRVKFQKVLRFFFFFPHGVTIKEVGNNLFVAIFVSEKDMVEVLDRSPWSFNKRLILLKRFNGDLIQVMLLYNTPFFGFRFSTFPLKA